MLTIQQLEDYKKCDECESCSLQNNVICSMHKDDLIIKLIDELLYCKMQLETRQLLIDKLIKQLGIDTKLK